MLHAMGRVKKAISKNFLNFEVGKSNIDRSELVFKPRKFELPKAEPSPIDKKFERSMN